MSPNRLVDLISDDQCARFRQPLRKYFLALAKLTDYLVADATYLALEEVC